MLPPTSPEELQRITDERHGLAKQLFNTIISVKGINDIDSKTSKFRVALSSHPSHDTKHIISACYGMVELIHDLHAHGCRLPECQHKNYHVRAADRNLT